MELQKSIRYDIFNKNYFSQFTCYPTSYSSTAFLDTIL